MFFFVRARLICPFFSACPVKITMYLAVNIMCVVDPMVEFDGELISKAQYDRRTPGKFKAEFIGLGMACLNFRVPHLE